MKMNQKGMGHLMVIVFVVLFAGLAAFALSRTFAARGGGGKGGGTPTTISMITTLPQNQGDYPSLLGQLVKEKGKSYWRTTGDTDFNTWNWGSGTTIKAPSIGDYEICFYMSAPKSANLKLTSQIGSTGKGGQLDEDVMIEYQGEPEVCRTVTNRYNDYSNDESWAIGYSLHIESSTTLDITKSTIKKL